MNRLFLGLWVLCFIPMRLFAWTDGELLIWMDTDRGHALKPVAQRFEKHFGIKATIEAPEKIADSFSLYKRMAKDSVLVRELKVCVDYGEVMPNIPQMARFFTYVGAALQIATEGRASAEAALREAEANLRRP